MTNRFLSKTERNFGKSIITIEMKGVIAHLTCNFRVICGVPKRQSAIQISSLIMLESHANFLFKVSDKSILTLISEQHF